MRVLALTNMYPPHHYGGYEINCQEAVSFFREVGHDVLVLTSDLAVPGVVGDPERRNEVRRELRTYWADHLIVRPSLRDSFAIERHNQRSLDRAITDHRPDVVSVWHMGALSLGLLTTCRRRGIPLVHVVNDDWPVYGTDVDGWARRWRRAGPLATVGERVLGVPCRTPDLGSAGTFCFVSEHTRRVAELHSGWTFPDATVGYCGVNPYDFPIGAAPARSSWTWRLLHVGRVDDRKGIDIAIRSLAHLPDEATLDIVGRGDDRSVAELGALVERLGLEDRVHFEVVERQQLAARYASADALLFPPRWEEPFGLVPLEAMACSTPVVATGTGGSAEFLIDGANCLLVPVDDDVGLANAVQRLANDPALRARLVRGGLLTARELSLPRWLTLLEQWHSAAAAGFEHGRPPHRARITDVLTAALAER